RSGELAHAADVARDEAQPGTGNSARSIARPATRQILAQLSCLADARAVRPAIRPRRRGYPSDFLMASASRLPDRARLKWPHGNRIVGNGGAGAKRISYRDSQVHCKRKGPLG